MTCIYVKKNSVFIETLTLFEIISVLFSIQDPSVISIVLQKQS